MKAEDTRARSFRWVLLIAFLLAIGFTGFHLVRAVRDAIYWKQHRDEPIEGWMPIGYVAHSYHVPPHILLTALRLPPAPPDHRPLSSIATARGQTVTQVAAILTDAIVHVRPPYPPPGPPPGPPATGAKP